MSIPELDDVIAETKPKLAVVPPPVQVPSHFERFIPQLTEALEGTFHSIDDVARAIVEGRAQFWPGQNAAMVTELDTISGAKVIRVWVAGGDMEELISMSPGIEAWARLQGCSAVLVEGRKGWERVLKDKGYDPWIVTVKKVL